MTDEEAVDNYLGMVQKENNLTMDQLKDVFASAGYSYEEGREQFKMLKQSTQCLILKLDRKVIVPRNLVETYYQENPVV